MSALLDDLKRDYLWLADGAKFGGERIADMSREELLSLCAYLIHRELGGSMYTVRLTNSDDGVVVSKRTDPTR